MKGNRIIVPKISIRIPVYNNPKLLENCLQSIKNQTFKNFEIILIDDCSILDYSYIVSLYKDLNISLFKNEYNLGAMKNMDKALHLPTEFKYVMVFHEDDLMHPQLLESLVEIIDNNDNVCFVGSQLVYFIDEKAIKEHVLVCEFDSYIYLDQPDFVRGILSWDAICFGSIIYRSKEIRDISFNFDKFGPVSDRPFLIGLMNNKKSAIIKHPFVYYRDHGKADNRWNDLHENQLINQYSFYRNFLPEKLSKEDKKLYFADSTRELINYFKLLSKENKSNIFRFILKAYWKRIFSFKYYLLRNRKIRKLIERIK